MFGNARKPDKQTCFERADERLSVVIDHFGSITQDPLITFGNHLDPNVDDGATLIDLLQARRQEREAQARELGTVAIQSQ